MATWGTSPRSAGKLRRLSGNLEGSRSAHLRSGQGNGGDRRVKPFYKIPSSTSGTGEYKNSTWADFPTVGSVSAAWHPNWEKNKDCAAYSLSMALRMARASGKPGFPS